MLTQTAHHDDIFISENMYHAMVRISILVDNVSDQHMERKVISTKNQNCKYASKDLQLQYGHTGELRVLWVLFCDYTNHTRTQEALLHHLTSCQLA